MLPEGALEKCGGYLLAIQMTCGDGASYCTDSAVTCNCVTTNFPQAQRNNAIGKVRVTVENVFQLWKGAPCVRVVIVACVISIAIQGPGI